MAPWKRNVPAPIGSARWWRHALTDVGLRLAGLVLVIVVMATGRVSGADFWVGIVGAVMMALLLVFPVMVCVIALRDPSRLEQRGGHGTDT